MTFPISSQLFNKMFLAWNSTLKINSKVTAYAHVTDVFHSQIKQIYVYEKTFVLTIFPKYEFVFLRINVSIHNYELTLIEEHTKSHSKTKAVPNRCSSKNVLCKYGDNLLENTHGEVWVQ